MTRDWFEFCAIIEAMDIGELDLKYMHIYNYRLHGPYTYTDFHTYCKYILHK